MAFTSGEVVFNTAMSGYQEILTDPSYCRQIVTLTYPHIGNTGCNAEDFESDANYAAGLVIRDLPLRCLQLALPGRSVVLSEKARHRRHCRYRYPQADPYPARKGRPGWLHLAGEVDEAKALAMASRASRSGNGMDLAKVVSAKAGYAWTKPSGR
jgi:carbamoyl-phosphate synthase small subunit